MSKLVTESGAKQLARHFLPERNLELSCIRAASDSEIGSRRGGCTGLDDRTSFDSSESDISAGAKPKALKQRGNWTGKLDFILSCIGYAVGLGNIWRFPHLCYENGGGAFLIPYFIFLVLCGIPMFVLELTFGQFGSVGPVTLFRISPIFRGVGYGMLIISALVCVYYNIIITWTLFYIFQSFSRVLPWVTCGNAWNTAACLPAGGEGAANLTHVNLTDVNMTYVNASLVNSTALLGSSNASEALVSSSEEFWKYYVLERSSGIEEIGGIRIELFATLILAWVIIFACLFKGVESSGKVVYVTATFPYLVLSVLLVKGVTLDGAYDGIMYFLSPDWQKLKDLKVWGAAATQLFYSVGAAWGSILTMASYNRFNHQCYRDAMIVPIINCLTSLFAGIVVFSIIGFMAHETGRDIKDVIEGGPGLVFVVYPEAVAKLPLSPLWAILFFSMILTIGIDSQFGMFECVISGIIDEMPWLRAKKVKFTAAMCFLLFLLGIPCVTDAGVYVLNLMDHYISGFPLMILCMMECIIVGWVYGDERFSRDMELMVGQQPHRWFRLCWKYVTPGAILFILIVSIVQHQPVTLDVYEYPTWSVAIGWVMMLASILAIPVFAVRTVLSKRGSLTERLLESIRPDPLWGPAMHDHRVEYRKSLDACPARFPQRYVSGVDNDSPQSSESCQSNAV